MIPKMETKSDRILTSAKLQFLLPLPCEINVFTAQDPSKNDTNSLQKKTLQPDPPKILNFQPQGASGWQHEPKRLPKGFLLGGRERPQNIIFVVRSCLGARMSPKSPQASILEALLIIFYLFRNLFYRLVSFLSAPAVGRGSNRKQLTIHSKLHDGCDGNALHSNAQHKHEKC